MKRVKFTGTVSTFYCVPNESETAVLYLEVTLEQKLPQGKEEQVIPAKRMRFLLGQRETETLTRGKISNGDEVTVFANEDDGGDVTYNVGLIRYKSQVIDASEYVRQM